MRRSEQHPAKLRAMLPELAFVLAPRQNLFFVELVDALAAEAQAAGARTSLHVGNFPPPRRDLVYVLVPPHEYFTLMHGRIGPPPEALRRTVFICAEQPNTPFFEDDVALARRGGAVFDINRDAVTEFARAGIVARHLQLGWSAGWDHFSERERDIDVLFIGGLSQRRTLALARYASTLWRRRVCYVLADNSRPHWLPSESFQHSDDKWELLEPRQGAAEHPPGRDPLLRVAAGRAGDRLRRGRGVRALDRRRAARARAHLLAGRRSTRSR